ncbi:MAG: hypothetical protein CM15mP42_05570 [Methanobacteriota archaeon]|nr:MAG: hypothetical protein CM15mP42_05570 [Euryarchaeota archaeon]
MWNPTQFPSNNDFKALQIGTGACVFGRGSWGEDRGGEKNVNWYSDGSITNILVMGKVPKIFLGMETYILDCRSKLIWC